MIYQIYCDKTELKYSENNICTIQNTCTDKHLGELGAWHDIYNDIKSHNYTTIGIYQARRAFHKNLHILLDEDFNVTDDSIYVSSYTFINETLFQQFVKCHANYVNVFKQCIPTEYLQHLNTRTIYAHNMMYCTANTFFKLYNFLFNIYNSHNLQTINLNDKFFSFISERLITIWILANNLNVKICNVLTYDKTSDKILYTINGIDR